MKLFTRVILTLGLFIGGTGMAMAENWGAIAVGPRGAYGWAVDFPSRAAAEAAALRECGGTCTRKLSFSNACAAYATTPRMDYGWAVRQTREAAQLVAMQECSKYGQGCQIRVWGCTTR
ncbi:MAG: DUF4189 domain-containing protein [Alphaproteobacteria bacterium]